ncbi:MAG: glycogen debranching protein GlgX [Pseudomonadota bacterium]
MLPEPGAVVSDGATWFSVWSENAERVELCLFDESEGEQRLDMLASGDGWHRVFAHDVGDGARYGFRAHGPFDPESGHRFDPHKLLIDPYAVEIDRPFEWHPALALGPDTGNDTAYLVPKSVVRERKTTSAKTPPVFAPGDLIYEVPVKAFTINHPDVPGDSKGTVAALGHPAIVNHLKRLGVGAVELMPITDWIDERHLAPLGLRNGWGYNPVNFFALDPRLAPGGVAELRQTVKRLHDDGIGVILDVVFNHTGESDQFGPTLCFRGLDNAHYYRHHGRPAELVNDTGCGNTVDCAHPQVVTMIIDSLRHFVEQAGIDGFRFDLAPILGRTGVGFDPTAPLFAAIEADPVLSDRVLIAEPWDIGPNGYQLGNFPHSFMEWNDRYRDDVRQFWRGDTGAHRDFATRLAGSSDVFKRDSQPGKIHTTRSVNFLAAHDGFALRDTVSFSQKHNEANGEGNRDGHNENFSWNNGVEGPPSDEGVIAARTSDIRSMLASLFLSRGTPMLTAGDEFGRSQRGNNNAYAQDNDITWLDWANRDQSLEAFVAALSRLRNRFPVLREQVLFNGNDGQSGPPDLGWHSPHGHTLTVADWEGEELNAFSMILNNRGARLAVLFNRGRQDVGFHLPKRDGWFWSLLELPEATTMMTSESECRVPARSVSVLAEVKRL